MLKTILSISGKPGLFKLISQAKNMLIVESLQTGKRQPAYAHEKIISLGDIAIFTDEEDVPLSEVLNAIKEKENGAKVTLDIKKADNETLRAYLAEVLPNFDRERVYPTDIKKLISWYNLLVETGNTDFVEEEKPQKDADVENTAATDDSVNEKEEKSKTKKATKKKAEYEAILMNGKYKPVRFPVQAFYGSRVCIQAPCVRISWQGILFSKQSFCNLVARLG